MTSPRHLCRFGCRIVDGLAPASSPVVVVREDGTPPGSIGKGWPGVAITTRGPVTECATAEFDEHGALLNSTTRSANW